jgi:crotonobetainyl-CoA:carnitine CoA-transferase CaiB-like acyl-CoA transferase
MVGTVGLADSDVPLPLQGVRVLEIGTMIAAPYATGMMGDYGATVIKIEPPVGDALRQSVMLSGTHFRFNEPNRNKLGICLDLTKPGGQQVLHKLVVLCDVVVTNLRPDVIPKLGLDYQTLRAANDRVIVVRLSAFGATGPHAIRRGTAPTIDGASGLATLNGYPDREPLRPAGFYPDLTAALFTVFGVLAALRHRDATGEGQEVDVAMTECADHLVGEAILGLTISGVTPGPRGNSTPNHAPNNCYPCRDPDTWIAISIETDDDWDRLRRCMDDPAADDGCFASNDLRKQNEPAIDDLIERWTSGQDVQALLARLRQAGLAAAAVANAGDVLNDPQLAHRGFYRTVTQHGPGSGPIPRVALPSPFPAPWRSSPAPAFAEHNDEVFRDLLHLEPDELARLYADGASCTELQAL